MTEFSFWVSMYLIQNHRTLNSEVEQVCFCPSSWPRGQVSVKSAKWTLARDSSQQCCNRVHLFFLDASGFLVAFWHRFNANQLFSLHTHMQTILDFQFLNCTVYSVFSLSLSLWIKQKAEVSLTLWGMHSVSVPGQK